MKDRRRDSSDSTPLWTEWGISVLNGVFGDYLRERGNGLAIDCAFYHQNRPLAISRESLQCAHPNPTARLCVLIHGLACNEGAWTFREAAEARLSYGTLLQKELGYTPFFLRYNTGLSIADNGRGFANLMNQLLACYPIGVDNIVLLGHSMGGLVVRSACHYGADESHSWIDKVQRVFYLGTPHHGADLEAFGVVTTAVLQAVPHPITRLIGNILNLRSKGIKDLHRSDRLHDGESSTTETALPWLPHAQHHLFAGTLMSDPEHPTSRLFGDGLVKPPRVHQLHESDHPLSQQANPGNVNVTLFPGVHHMGLANDPAVYRQIRQFCATD